MNQISFFLFNFNNKFPMRKLFYIFLLFMCPKLAFTQGFYLNNALKIKLTETSETVPHTLLVEANLPKLLEASKKTTLLVNYYSGHIASITCDISTLSGLIEDKIVYYAEFVRSNIQPMGDTMQIKNRIKAVRQGLPPLAQAYDGDGIVIGFIDTGIDVFHPDFKDAQGKSRIKFIWDQMPVSGSTVPAPFNYGIEWTNTQIDANLCTHSDLASYGHGTYVSGIAAGNGLGNGRHEGCAPKADIIMVALDFNKTGPVIADAVQYIFTKAVSMGKPCVINASVGDYYGSHDGTNLESKLIESMVKSTTGRVMVASSGNAGNYKYHVKTQPSVTDTLFTWLKKSGTTLEYWLYGDTSQVKNLKFNVAANRSNYSNLGGIGFKNYNYALSSVQNDTLKNNSHRIGIVKSSASINNYGVYELYIKIVADTTNLFWRLETTGNGLHHAWNFDFVNSNLPSISQYPNIANYVMPDTMYTLVSSFQCSDEIITVGNYFNLNRYYDVHDSLRTIPFVSGAIAQNSSSGPTRDGRLKPDVTASGNYIFSAMPMGMQGPQIAVEPSAVAQGSLHIRGGGTSASAPVVAGLAALYLQAHPTANNQQVKNAIINCTYSDNFTGSALPNYLWGYGKLDGKAAMVCGENLVGINSISLNQSISGFPNPFQEKVNFSFEKKLKGKLQVFNSEGKLLFEELIDADRYELNSSQLPHLTKGLLLVRIISDNGSHAFKLIKE
jgi:subtilisin family serine protease